MNRLPLRIAVLTLLQLTVGANECGIPYSKAKIVGGETVDISRYPWFVALVPHVGSTPLSVSCGGALITSRHVLTAAHCFVISSDTKPEKLYRATFQVVNRCTQTNAPSSGITRVDIYPSFNTNTLRGDIAVATLERAVSYMPACLPAKDSVVTGKALIIGFGSTQMRSQPLYPCQLQEAQVTILTRKQCLRSDLEVHSARIPGTFCAGVLQGGVDSCDGDSGGPLMTVGSSGTYTLRGITSFGEGCARQNLPGVYTQVSSYRDFIDSIIHRYGLYDCRTSSRHK